MSRQRFPSDNNRYTVSFPEGLKDRLKQGAEESNRTLNAEIVTRLQMSFECFDLANQPNAPYSAWERLMARAIVFRVAINPVPITCSQCGAACSCPAIPPGTVIRAFIQCPECAQKEQQNEPTHHA